LKKLAAGGAAAKTVTEPFAAARRVPEISATGAKLSNKPEKVHFKFEALLTSAGNVILGP